MQAITRLIPRTLLCACICAGLGHGHAHAAADDPPAAPTTNPPATTPEKTTPAATVPTSDDVLHCEPQRDLPRQKLRFFGEEWECELCLDETSRSTGMGARSEFPPATAMVFVYTDASLLSFWMKDCLIDMDMVFVDKDGRITAVHEAKREPLRRKSQSQAAYERTLKRYGSNRRAQFVIELPAGSVKRIEPKLGDKVDIDWNALAARAK